MPWYHKYIHKTEYHHCVRFGGLLEKNAKKLEISWKQPDRERFEVLLTEICIKNEKWNFFSRTRKLDVDMIWVHDRYVKTSPGSTLQSSNNGLAIYDDLGRKAGNFELVSKDAAKKKDFQLFWKMSKFDV